MQGLLENMSRGWMLLEPFMGGCLFILGALIGSYLNVVIYRVPRGMSVNEPKRSFCPGCKKQIPYYRNIPLVTWLLQRGRCAACETRIPVYYFLVELLTAVLFWAIWQVYPGGAAVLGLLCITLLIAISFIDGEHYVIPVLWCWVAIPIAIAGACLWPEMLQLSESSMAGLMGLTGGAQGLSSMLYATAGCLLGYGGLALVVLLGKLAFGRKKVEYEQAEKWFLREPTTDEEQLQFVVGDEAVDWGEVFYRKTDRIELQGEQFQIDGQQIPGNSLVIRERTIEVGEQTFHIEQIQSASGLASGVVIPREAMGGGDPPLLGMIGAFIGPVGVLFTLLTSCLYAIAAAVLGRVGFGKPLPYGPFLSLGGLTWILGGYRVWEWYLSLLGLG